MAAEPEKEIVEETVEEVYEEPEEEVYEESTKEVTKSRKRRSTKNLTEEIFYEEEPDGRSNGRNLRRADRRDRGGSL